MTQTREDVNARVGKAAGLAVAGAIAGMAAYFLDVHTNAKENFVLWTLIAAAGSFYTSSIVTLVKALSSRGKPTGTAPILGIGGYALYIFMHYTLVLFSMVLAVGLNDSASELGGFAVVMVLFALINALGGFIGGIIFGWIIYEEMSEKGWNSPASFVVAVLAGLVEAALCYVVQFNLGLWLLSSL